MKQDIFWLQVTVDDVIPMQVLHSLADLLDYLPSLSLTKPAISFFRRAEEVAIETWLKKKVYTILINKGMIQLDHIGM